MFDISTFPIADAVRRAAQLSQEDYQRLYRQPIEQPDTFWAEQAKRFLDWTTPWHTVNTSDIQTGATQWFAGGQLNVSYNCIDRHLAQRTDQPAFIWEGDDPTTSSTISYRQLHQNVSRLANVLKSRGVKKGDRVCIYMPMIPQAAYAMLACTQIGPGALTM